MQFEIVIGSKAGGHKLFIVEIGTDNILKEVGRLAQYSIPVFEEMLA